MTCEGRLAWNTLLNLTTGLVLLVLNLLFVPLLLQAFGTELYGTLTLTWMVLAHLGWLDLGLSRASARYVARELAAGRPVQAAKWSWTALFAQSFLGVCGAVLLWLLAPLLVRVLQVHPARWELVILALRLFAVALPLDLAARSLSGVLQAGQRFDWINALNLLSVMGTYGVYALGILRGGDFVAVIYGLLALRFLSLAGHYWGAVRVLPSIKSPPDIGVLVRGYWGRARQMLWFGGWITAIALIGPLLLYFDQWVIGVLLGVATLPYYTVPFNLLARLGVLPSSLTATLFPAFSALEARLEWGRIEDYLIRAHRYLLLALTPLLFALFVWGPELLRLWLGAPFAAEAALPFRVLVCGFGIALLAPLSGTLLEAAGRPDVVARLYLVELPFNLIAVLLLTRAYGLVGAASSYTLRAIVETATLWFVLYRVLPLSWIDLWRGAFRRVVGVLVVFGGVSYLLRGARVEDPVALAGTFVVLAGYAVSILLFLMDAEDRARLKQFLSVKKRESKCEASIRSSVSES